MGRVVLSANADACGASGNRASATKRGVLLKAPKKRILPEQLLTSQGVSTTQLG